MSGPVCDPRSGRTSPLFIPPPPNRAGLARLYASTRNRWATYSLDWLGVSSVIEAPVRT